MSRYTIAGIAVLGVATVALAITLGIVLATDDDGAGGNHPMGDGYAGMMGAMATMDPDEMLERMREVLGEDGYEAMLAHMQEHQAGTAGPVAPGVDGMMHEMMDGMMSMLSPGSGGRMFPNDEMPMSRN